MSDENSITIYDASDICGIDGGIDLTVAWHERHDVDNHLQLDCLFNNLFRLATKIKMATTFASAARIFDSTVFILIEKDYSQSLSIIRRQRSCFHIEPQNMTRTVRQKYKERGSENFMMVMYLTLCRLCDVTVMFNLYFQFDLIQLKSIPEESAGTISGARVAFVWHDQ